MPEQPVYLQAEGHRNTREKHRLDVMYGRGEWVRCWHLEHGWTAHRWDYHQGGRPQTRPLWEHTGY